MRLVMIVLTALALSSTVASAQDAETQGGASSCVLGGTCFGGDQVIESAPENTTHTETINTNNSTSHKQTISTNQASPATVTNLT